MCNTHIKVTHIKQQKYFYHLKGREYNKDCVLYPRPLRWWKYFCCFMCHFAMGLTHCYKTAVFLYILRLRGLSRSLIVVPFESLGAVYYSLSIVTISVSVAVCDIFSVKEWCDFEIRVRVRSRSLEMAPFDRSHMGSYKVFIVTITLSCIVCQI